MMTPFQTIIFFLLLATIGHVNGIICSDKCFKDIKICLSDNGCVLNHCCRRYSLNNQPAPTNPCDICALEKCCEKDPKAQFCVSHNCCK